MSLEVFSIKSSGKFISITINSFSFFALKSINSIIEAIYHSTRFIINFKQ